MLITFPRVLKTEYIVLISTHGMFQKRNYRDVKRKPAEVSKGQSNKTEYKKTELNLSYLVCSVS